MPEEHVRRWPRRSRTPVLARKYHPRVPIVPTGGAGMLLLAPCRALRRHLVRVILVLASLPVVISLLLEPGT